MSEEKRPERVEIEEKQGRLPRWGWIFIVTCLVYGFLIGPFNWFSP